MRWNLSSKKNRFLEADVLIVSIPKSGRTWLRVFLARYLSETTGVDYSVDLASPAPPGIPKIYFTHDRWEHRTARHAWERIRGKFLIPGVRCRDGRILLMARDPRDVLVSLYFQLTKRDKVFSGTLPEMIRSPRFGIRPMIDVLNEWIEEFGGNKRFELLRYESFRAAPLAEFRRLLERVGLPVDEGRLASAVDFASFNRMKEMEKRGSFGESILTAGNPDDPESFKVRRGRVGGYVDYLSGPDLEFIDGVMQNLSERFGYAGSGFPAASPGGNPEYRRFQDRLPASRRRVSGLCHPTLTVHLDQIKKWIDSDWKDCISQVLSERPSRIAVADLSGRDIPYCRVVIKEFGGRSRIHRLLSPLGRSRSLAALSTALKLASCGVPTPVPLLAYEVRNGGFTGLSVIVTAFLEDAIKARNVLNDPAVDPSGVRTLISAMADATRRMHDAGILHRDLSLGNFLIRNDAPDLVYLIDLSRAIQFRRLPLLLRLFDLARMNLQSRWPLFYRDYCGPDARLLSLEPLLRMMIRMRRLSIAIRKRRIEEPRQE